MKGKSVKGRARRKQHIKKGMTRESMKGRAQRKRHKERGHEEGEHERNSAKETAYRKRA
jgi:hypothetical protein